MELVGGKGQAKTLPPSCPLEELEEETVPFIWFPRLIQSSDYYPMLFTHIDTNDTAMGNHEQIKNDYIALGEWVKGTEAQVVVCLSILPVKGKGHS